MTRSEPACWRDFLHDCVASTPAQQGDRLKEAVRLWPACRVALGPLLACGAYESAALLVLGADRPFLLSRGGSGTCLASLPVHGGREEITAEAATPALALLAAHAAAALADASGEVAARREASMPVRLH